MNVSQIRFLLIMSRTQSPLPCWIPCDISWERLICRLQMLCICSSPLPSACLHPQRCSNWRIWTLTHHSWAGLSGNCFGVCVSLCGLCSSHQRKLLVRADSSRIAVPSDKTSFEELSLHHGPFTESLVQITWKQDTNAQLHGGACYPWAISLLLSICTWQYLGTTE